MLVVGGPTASGKTNLAIQLASHYQSVIISADSRQFYSELNIGVARPNANELAQVKHYFIADRSIQQPLTAGAYAIEAITLLEKLWLKNPVTIVCGGSGLFIKAITEGLDDNRPTDLNLRNELNALLKEKGLAYLQQMLLKIAPKATNALDINNPKRVIRALEILQLNGEIGPKQPTDSPNFDVLYIGITHDRNVLYNAINQRVLKMLADGLEKEAFSLYPFSTTTPVLQTVGYSEFFEYFRGNISYTTAVAQIQQNSRRYAKRQLTWFNNQFNMHWFKPHEAYNNTLALVKQKYDH